MKIAYITQFLPFPIDHGGVIKTVSTLRALQKQNHNIFIFTFISDKSNYKYVNYIKKEGYNIGAIIFNNLHSTENIKAKIIYYLHTIFSLKPFSVAKFYDSKLQEKINTFVRKEKPDCIWIDNFTMAQYIPKKFAGLKILDAHNVESEFFFQMTLIDSFFRWKIFALIESLKYRFYEIPIYLNFDKIFAICRTDQTYITKISGKKVEVLPPFIHKTSKHSSFKIKGSILFVGSLKWYPNKDAIYWFLTKIYPNIIKKVPKVKIDIIGHIPRRSIFPNYPNVVFHGYQKNIEKFYQKANVFIVPVRYGSGIRIKVLEAIAYKIPIVSTTSGLAGIEIKNPEDFLIADKPKEFSEKVLSVLVDKEIRKHTVESQTSSIDNMYFNKNYISNHLIELKSR